MDFFASTPIYGTQFSGGKPFDKILIFEEATAFPPSVLPKNGHKYKPTFYNQNVTEMEKSKNIILFYMSILINKDSRINSEPDICFMTTSWLYV